MFNVYYYSNPAGEPYRLTSTNLVADNTVLPDGLLNSDGDADDKGNYFNTKMVCLNADGSIKPNCHVYYRGIKSRSEGVIPTKEAVQTLVDNEELPPASFWECLTIKDGTSTLIAEGNYPAGGNLSTTTASGFNRFHVTRASGIFKGAASVDIEYDTPADGETAAEWNPFGDDSSEYSGNRRFRRMTINEKPIHTSHLRNSDLLAVSTLEGDNSEGQYITKSVALSNGDGSLRAGHTAHFRGMGAKATGLSGQNSSWESVSIDLGNGNVVIAHANYDSDLVGEGVERRSFEVLNSSGTLAGSSRVVITQGPVFSEIEIRA